MSQFNKNLLKGSYKMDMKILITIWITIIGWAISYFLSRRKELLSRRSDKRVDYLISAYRNLESSANREQTNEIRDKIENSIADVHLFGTEKQIKLANDFSKSISETGEGSYHELLLQLREDLREELKLSRSNIEINYLRFARKSSS